MRDTPSSSLRLAVFSTFAAALALTACEKDTANYTTGPGDPALEVSDEVIEQVQRVLDEQEAMDRAEGLRAEAPSSSASPAGGGPKPPQPGAPPSDSVLIARFDIGFLRGAVPAGWMAEPPANLMRLAQFRLPRAEGDYEDGLLTVVQSGGGIEANIARWHGQFTQPDGRSSAEAAAREEIAAATFPTTLIDLAGTMEPSAMPSGPQERKPGMRLLGGIVETPRGLVFFKATGPEKTMAANREKIIEFLKGLGS